MSEARIVIPQMPPRECAPNFHGHWTQARRAAREFRRAAGWATVAARWECVPFRAGEVCALDVLKDGPVVMDIEVAWCCGRKRMDTDNLVAACKPMRDGIADVLWGGEDKHVRVGEVRQTRGDGSVTVVLRGAE